MNADSILTFWFVECRPWQWFRRSDHFDALVRQRFGDLVIRALAGELEHWSTEPGSSLALVLLLDQFSRQLWRDQPRAFSGDPQALRLSRQGLQRGWIAAEPEQPRRQFWLMPHLHSEDATVVRQAIPLLERHVDAATVAVARRNLAQLEQFGRYPRRNQALGRISNPAESAYLRAERPSR